MLAGEEFVGRDRTLFRCHEQKGEREWEGFVPGTDVVDGVRKGWENKGDEEGRVRSMLDKYAACASTLLSFGEWLMGRFPSGGIRETGSIAFCRAAISC
jgi:hypothetical protein